MHHIKCSRWSFVIAISLATILFTSCGRIEDVPFPQGRWESDSNFFVFGSATTFDWRFDEEGSRKWVQGKYVLSSDIIEFKGHYVDDNGLYKERVDTTGKIIHGHEVTMIVDGHTYHYRKR
ncbi:MAG: hypothetical protein IT462_11445 [Planctomycetes bacterium]|nr:hypothetical protein [Planctomycetota bacterium]